MRTGREAELERDGFVPFTLLRVGIPYQAWTVNLDVMTSKGLPLGERTVLRLVDAGLGDRVLISRLMGLEDQPLFADLIDRLVQDDAFYIAQTGLELSPIGKLMLANTTRDQAETLKNLQLLYDPYQERLQWQGEEIKESKLQEFAAVALNVEARLTQQALEDRQPEIQSLLVGGLPDEQAENPPDRTVVAVRPLTSETVYDVAQMQLWFHPDEHNWAGVLVNDGEADLELMEAVNRFEREDGFLLPLTHQPNAPYAEHGKVIQAFTRAATVQRQSARLADYAVREAQRDVIFAANKELVVVLPWWRDGDIDAELTEWIEECVRLNVTLRVTIFFGRDTRNMGSESQRKQEAMLRRLRQLEKQASGRLQVHDIYELAGHSAVIGDETTVLTAVEFMPYQPFHVQGITRRVGWKVTNRNLLQDLKADLTSIALG